MFIKLEIIFLIIIKSNHIFSLHPTIKLLYKNFLFQYSKNYNSVENHVRIKV